MNNGYHVHEMNPFYVQAVAEHRELHAAVEGIRKTLAAHDEHDVDDKYVKLVLCEIRCLRDKLDQHFAQEEEGGYLEEAVGRLPQVAPQADTLQRQHGALLKLANLMLADAEAGGDVAHVWRKLRTGYDAFAKRLHAHEAAENVLLQRAFNEDPGIET
jgi:hypothetical protein